MKWPDTTSIIIPSFKAARPLRLLLPDVMQYAPANKILIVDDASYDETPLLCSEFSIPYLSHKINKGKGAALVTGFNYLIAAGTQWIITMDADGQHASTDLFKFIDAITKMPTTGICIGAREMRPGIMPPERILSNKLTSFILGICCGIPILDSQCGYRIYNVDFLKRITIMFNRFEMESEIIMKAAFTGFPVTFISIQTLYLEGSSHISHVVDTLRWINAILRIRMQRNRIINRNISCK
jgi:glycosyltransferase involved in cell wall biosynthesis